MHASTCIARARIFTHCTCPATPRFSCKVIKTVVHAHQRRCKLKTGSSIANPRHLHQRGNVLRRQEKGGGRRRRMGRYCAASPSVYHTPPTAGFGAAKHLSEQGYAVTLVDASPNPGGLSAGWRTPQGRAVEAGFKGFWYQYANIFSLVRELGIEWPFTPFTTSGFWSPSGLTTEAPVFSEKIRLPTMLGQFIWTAQLPWTISVPDRLTYVGGTPMSTTGPRMHVFLFFQQDVQHAISGG